METSPILLIPSYSLRATIILSHNAACSIWWSIAVFELASPRSSVYCDSPLSVHSRKAERMNALTFMRRRIFSRAGTLTQGGFWSLCHTDSDVAFLLHSVPRPCLSVFFLLPISIYSSLLTPLPCCLSRFLPHSAFQPMSGTMAARIKATGFSRFMMNCRCLTDAASKIHWEGEKNKPINYQQQVICVKLSQAGAVEPELQQSFLFRRWNWKTPAVWEKSTGVLSCGITINLSFRSSTWKGHLVISHMVLCGIRFRPQNLSIDHWTRGVTLTLTL